jgi:hypothetical protein
MPLSNNIDFSVNLLERNFIKLQMKFPGGCVIPFVLMLQKSAFKMILSNKTASWLMWLEYGIKNKGYYEIRWSVGYFNTMAFQHLDISKPWYFDILVFQHLGISAPWHFNTLAFQGFSISTSWHFNTFAVQRLGISTLCRFITLLASWPSV